MLPGHSGTRPKLAPKINKIRTSQNLDFSTFIDQLGHGGSIYVLTLIIASLFQSMEAGKVRNIFEFTPSIK